MRKLVLLSLLAVVVLPWAMSERSPSGAVHAPTHPPAADETDSGCVAGCSLSNHPITPLSFVDFEAHLETLATLSGEARERALDTLLFHGEQVRGFLHDFGQGPLSDDQAASLRRELSRTHARLWMRLVDENGVLRAELDGVRFPIGRKEHVHVESTRDLQVPEISGTVHRTGVEHLWTRL